LCYAPRAIDGMLLCLVVNIRLAAHLTEEASLKTPQKVRTLLDGFICIGKSWIPVLLLVFRFGNECLIAPVSILKILTKNFP